MHVKFEKALEVCHNKVCNTVYWTYNNCTFYYSNQVIMNPMTTCASSREPPERSDGEQIP